MVSLHLVIDDLVIVMGVVVVGAESVREGDIAAGQDHFFVLPVNLEVTGLKVTRFQHSPVLFGEPAATAGVEEEGLSYLGEDGRWS